MQATIEDTAKSMEQYLITFLIGAATVTASKCSMYAERAVSPEVSKFFTRNRSMLLTTIERLRNILDPKGNYDDPSTTMSDIDMLFDWHKDTMASASSYFSASLQVPSGKVEQEFLKQATASKVIDSETRALIIKLGGTIV